MSPRLGGSTTDQSVGHFFAILRDYLCVHRVGVAAWFGLVWFVSSFSISHPETTERRVAPVRAFSSLV